MGFKNTDKMVLEKAVTESWSSGSTAVVLIIHDGYIYTGTSSI